MLCLLTTNLMIIAGKNLLALKNFNLISTLAFFLCASLCWEPFFQAQLHLILKTLERVAEITIMKHFKQFKESHSARLQGNSTQKK